MAYFKTSSHVLTCASFYNYASFGSRSNTHDIALCGAWSLILLMYKGLKVKPESLQMILSQRRGVAEINTQWSFRFPLLVKIPIRKASFPKQSGTGMPSLIHSSPLLNCRTIAYLNSLPLLELGTNLPRPSPGEVLSFWLFTSKL